MDLYSQIFSSARSMFSNQFIDREEINRKVKILFVSCDGSIRTTISYLTHKLDSVTYYPREDHELNGAYTSVVQDIVIDFDINSNGYYPKGGKKRMFQEFVIYDKTANHGDYEDRGYKHWYERHHSCNNKNGGLLCREFCTSKLNTKVNYKRDDVYQLENEEMSCDNVNVNYYKLSRFYEQRSELDSKMKTNAFNTLIPPPMSSTDKKTNRVRVYITEINADFSCNDVTPCSIQDPVWVNYDMDSHQVQLDKPLLSTDDLTGATFIFGGREIAY